MRKISRVYARSNPYRGFKKCLYYPLYQHTPFFHRRTAAGQRRHGPRRPGDLCLGEADFEVPLHWVSLSISQTSPSSLSPSFFTKILTSWFAVLQASWNLFLQSTVQKQIGRWTVHLIIIASNWKWQNNRANQRLAKSRLGCVRGDVSMGASDQRPKLQFCVISGISF